MLYCHLRNSNYFYPPDWSSHLSLWAACLVFLRNRPVPLQEACFALKTSPLVFLIVYIRYIQRYFWFALSPFSLFLLKFSLYTCNNLTYSVFTIYFEMYVLPLVIPSKMLATFNLFPLLYTRGNTMHDLYFWCLLLQNAIWKFQLANRLVRLRGCLWTHRLLQWNLQSWAWNRELLCLPSRVLFLACLC